MPHNQNVEALAVHVLLLLHQVMHNLYLSLLHLTCGTHPTWHNSGPISSTISNPTQSTSSMTCLFPDHMPYADTPTTVLPNTKTQRSTLTTMISHPNQYPSVTWFLVCIRPSPSQKMEQYQPHHSNHTSQIFKRTIALLPPELCCLLQHHHAPPVSLKCMDKLIQSRLIKIGTDRSVSKGKGMFSWVCQSEDETIWEGYRFVGRSPDQVISYPAEMFLGITAIMAACPISNNLQIS